MDFDFVKSSYEAELTRKAHLTSAISPLLSLCTLIGGVLIYFLNNLDFDGSISGWVFGCGIALTSIALLGGIYNLLRASTGFTYKYLALGGDLQDWFAKILAHCSGDRARAEREFKDGLQPLYLEAYAKNSRSNLSKAGYIGSANRMLAIAAALAIATSLPYFIRYFREGKKPMPVQIVTSS